MDIVSAVHVGAHGSVVIQNIGEVEGGRGVAVIGKGPPADRVSPFMKVSAQL
jgi:hypothetical protein